MQAVAGCSAKAAANELAQKLRELNGLLIGDMESDVLFERLCEDNVSGKINSDCFFKLSRRYEQEQGENGKRSRTLLEKLRNKDTCKTDMGLFFEAVRLYTGATELT